MTITMTAPVFCCMPDCGRQTDAIVREGDDWFGLCEDHALDELTPGVRA